jgi:hypothetical protein
MNRKLYIFPKRVLYSSEYLILYDIHLLLVLLYILIKGNKTEYGNHQDISLTSNAFKFSTFFLSRLNSIVHKAAQASVWAL